MGGRIYLALFIASGLAGSVLQVATQADPQMPIVGASAGVAGVMAAYLVIFPRVKIYQMFRILRFRVRVAWFLVFLDRLEHLRCNPGWRRCGLDGSHRRIPGRRVICLPIQGPSPTSGIESSPDPSAQTG